MYLNVLSVVRYMFQIIKVGRNLIFQVILSPTMIIFNVTLTTCVDSKFNSFIAYADFEKL